MCILKMAIRWSDTSLPTPYPLRSTYSDWHSQLRRKKASQEMRNSSAKGMLLITVDQHFSSSCPLLTSLGPPASCDVCLSPDKIISGRGCSTKSHCPMDNTCVLGSSSPSHVPGTTGSVAPLGPTTSFCSQCCFCWACLLPLLLVWPSPIWHTSSHWKLYLHWCPETCKVPKVCAMSYVLLHRKLT